MKLRPLYFWKIYLGIAFQDSPFLCSSANSLEIQANFNDLDKTYILGACRPPWS